MGGNWWRFGERGFRAAEITHTWFWILSFFKWPALLMAGLAALAWSAWAYVARLPSPVIGLCAVAAFVLILIAANLAAVAYVRISAAIRTRGNASSPDQWPYLGDVREL